MLNADLARQVVFELFQELDKFNLGEYQKFDDQGKGIQRLVNFLARAATALGFSFRQEAHARLVLQNNGEPPISFTTDRDLAMQHESLYLLGLEHPTIGSQLNRFANAETHSRALAGKAGSIRQSGLLTIWKINTQGKDGQIHHRITRIGMSLNGTRAPWLEHLDDALLSMEAPVSITPEEWKKMAINNKSHLQELLHRELSYCGVINAETTYAATLLAVVGIES